MSNLSVIQDQILQNILSQKIDNLSFIKNHNGIDASERLRIYRRSVLENFVDNLKINYPGIWKLIGDDCARGVSFAYAHDFKHITSRGKMHDFGSMFPEFLKNFPSTRHLSYLHDFAKLEWFRNISHEAPNDDLIQESELLNINHDLIEKYKLFFNSSVFFMKSEFALSKIQDLIDSKNNEELLMVKEPTYAVIYRLNDEVKTAWIDKAKWLFLSSIANRKTLGQALYDVENSNLEINLEKVFEFIFQRQMVTKIKMD